MKQNASKFEAEMNNPDQPASETREEILPCPFCGNPPAIMRNAANCVARCRPCGITWMDAQDWNKRALTSSGEASNPPSAAQIETDPRLADLSPEFRRSLAIMADKVTRTEILEKDLAIIRSNSEHDICRLMDDIGKMRQENRRLREALEKIAVPPHPDAVLANHIAKEALSAPATVEESLPVRDGDWVEKAAEELTFSFDVLDASSHRASAQTVAKIIRRHLSESQPGDGWRPIESAPRDGTVFLGYNGHYVMQAWWSNIGKRWVYGIKGFAAYEFEPTNWQPLPEPPREGRAG